MIRLLSIIAMAITSLQAAHSQIKKIQYSDTEKESHRNHRKKPKTNKAKTHTSKNNFHDTLKIIYENDLFRYRRELRKKIEIYKNINMIHLNESTTNPSLKQTLDPGKTSLVIQKLHKDSKDNFTLHMFTKNIEDKNQYMLRSEFKKWLTLIQDSQNEKVFQQFYELNNKSYPKTLIATIVE